MYREKQASVTQKRPIPGLSSPGSVDVGHFGHTEHSLTDPPPETTNRGRQRSRDHSAVETSASINAGITQQIGEIDPTETSPDGDDVKDGPSRKRRRSRKGLDKKFECPHEGCGKSYSRAEHLYRHQLNHTPKQIFKCDFPDCHRTFVRQDLRTRHKERHTARGSQLQRKEAFLHNVNSSSPLAPNSHPSSFDHADGLQFTRSSEERTYNLAPQPALGATSDRKSNLMIPPMSDASMTPSDAGSEVFSKIIDGALNPKNTSTAGSVTSSIAGVTSSESDGIFHADDSKSYDTFPNQSIYKNQTYIDAQAPYGIIDTTRNQQQQTITSSGTHFARSSQQSSPTTPSIQGLSLSSPYGASSTTSQPRTVSATMDNSLSIPPVYSASQVGFTPQASMTHFSLPPQGYTNLSRGTPSRDSDATLATSPPTSFSSIDHSLVVNGTTAHGVVPEPTTFFDPIITPNSSMPVFGGEGYVRSPFAMADDFAAWLFSDPQSMTASPLGRSVGTGIASYVDSVGAQFQAGYLPNDFAMNGCYPQGLPQQHPMAVTSILDTSLPESLLSEEKRQELIDLIESRFNENDHAPIKKQKEALLDGNGNGDGHVLSLRMMQTYISSFWYHLHPQLPILHKPTFVADKTPNLLLIAMMAIGASCLDKGHGHAVTQAGAGLSTFLAWYLRWGIFSDKDFTPPAKLWVFQALLLLEMYEKMYSTRALHERAHMHHATTITLMRRGSSLIGKSALDSPPSLKDEKLSSGTNGSNNHPSSGTSTPERWWNHWITNEATRRAAFAAFVMDSTHATMFGHKADMVAHEMRLPLPCDEALWSATTSAEVGRVEANLNANGVKPTTFLEGLRKTLNKQTVRTNAFGRTILMAGLLSVSWHMNQRDLQVTSLGVSQALGGRDKWRVSLLKASDFWVADFDDSLAKTASDAGTRSHTPSKQQEDIVVQSRTVLHHLAHMAMHVDIVDCQIFAGARRVLGRTIGQQDHISAQRRMKENWAPTAKARDATFFALRFLSEVLLPKATHVNHLQAAPQPGQSMIYSARDDFLINRPWVLYFAALIVWSYGYALDGPLSSSETQPKTPTQRELEMYEFLRRVGGVESPENLSTVRGRNQCVGLLIVLKDMFSKTRWELLHEADILLTNCLNLLTGVK